MSTEHTQHSMSVAEVRELVHQHCKRSWWANAISDDGTPLGDYPAGAYNEGLAEVNAAFDSLEEQLELLKDNSPTIGAAYLRLKEQLEALQAERDRLREGVTDAADILDVIGKWFSAGADTNNMEPILDNALPLMAKWEEKLAAISYPASGRTISATITGDGSGVALPLITEGFGPPRTWNPSGGAGSSTASSADDAGAEEPSPASSPRCTCNPGRNGPPGTWGGSESRTLQGPSHAPDCPMFSTGQEAAPVPAKERQ